MELVFQNFSAARAKMDEIAFIFNDAITDLCISCNKVSNKVSLLLLLLLSKISFST